MPQIVYPDFDEVERREKEWRRLMELGLNHKIESVGQYQEVLSRNKKDAMRMLEESGRFDADAELIKEVHLALFGGLYSWAGHFRNREDPVPLIGGDEVSFPFKAVPWHTIDAALDVAYRHQMSFMQGPIEPEKAVQAIADFHHRFLECHPFRDGNGRVARLLMDQQLRCAFGPARWEEIPVDSWKYGDALRAIDNRRDFAPLEELIREIIRKAEVSREI